MGDILYQEIIASVLAYIFTTVSFITRNLVTISIYSYENYPQFTKTIAIIIATYILYKFSIAVIRVWINLIISVLKTVLLLATISLATLLYFRGWNSLVYQDLPYFKSIFFNLLQKNMSSFPSWISLLLKNQDNLKSTFENLNKDDINSYFSYFDENFKDGKSNSYDHLYDFVNKGFDHLENSGIDWKNVGSNVLDFLNNNNHR